MTTQQIIDITNKRLKEEFKALTTKGLSVDTNGNLTEKK